jgi:hypothetical protein
VANTFTVVVTDSVTGEKATASTSFTVSSTAGTLQSTSANNGSLPAGGAYTYSGITASNGYNTYVINDVWNPISGASQTIYAYNPGDWYAIANMPKGNTAVISYPDCQQLMGDVPLSSFTEISSSYTENMNATSSTIGEAAYDIWCNDWANEVMVWVDIRNENLNTSGDHYVGAMTVATQEFGIFRNGTSSTSEIICALGVTPTNSAGTIQQSGTVDILTTLKTLETMGILPANSTLTAIDFGFEVCSTGGVNETFAVTEFTIISAPTNLDTAVSARPERVVKDRGSML